jgi:hypothetical protein
MRYLRRFVLALVAVATGVGIASLFGWSDAVGWVLAAVLAAVVGVLDEILWD